MEKRVRWWKWIFLVVALIALIAGFVVFGGGNMGR